MQRSSPHIRICEIVPINTRYVWLLFIIAEVPKFELGVSPMVIHVVLISSYEAVSTAIDAAIHIIVL